MLARSRSRPFSAPGWRFEMKYDGFRLLAGTGRAAGPGRGPVALGYRSGADATHRFPDLLPALERLAPRDAVLDGEVVVLGADGRPSFGRLQKRARLGAEALERAAPDSPAVYFVFDLLAVDGEDLRSLSLAERTARLVPLLESLSPGDPVRAVEFVAARGEEVYREIVRLGLEGMVAKREAAPYTGGRSDDWVKVRAGASERFLVTGWTGTGAVDELVLAELAEPAVDGGEPVLSPVGRVSAGLVPHERRRLAGLLAPLARPDGPQGRGAGASGVNWVEPRLVVEVRFAERTGAGRLRHPLFVRLDEEAGPEDCLRPGPEAEPTAPLTAPRPTGSARTDAAPPAAWREKTFWPESGLTKADLYEYYRTIAPRILPYLADRPVVLERYPEGIDGPRFFQKNAPEGLPGFIRVATTRSGRRALVADDAESLLHLASLATIPLHVESARLAHAGHPDWAILDLDAKSASFAAAVTTARAIHRLAREIELPAYLKTSGATGLHVLLPLGRRLDHLQARQLAELLARVVVAELEAAGLAIASVERSPAARPGKIYVDFLQNGAGKLLAAPWCVRALPGAPVSTPLFWEDLERGIEPCDFTIQTVPDLVAERMRDPWEGLFEGTPDLAAILERLGRRGLATGG